MFGRLRANRGNKAEQDGEWGRGGVGAAIEICTQVG